MANKAFGYALDDIDLIGKAVSALRRVVSNTPAHQLTIQDLQLLETVLRRVQRVSLSHASEDTLRNLQHCDHFCRPPLDRFLHRLKHLEPHLDRTLTPESAAISAFSPPVWATKLEEEVIILQKFIGKGLRVIEALLCVEELKCDVATNEPLSGDIRQIIDSLQKRLFDPCESKSGRGHYYRDIQTSGNAYSHNGDNYFLNMTSDVPFNDLWRKLDEIASTHQVEQLISLVKDIKIMLPRASSFIEKNGPSDAFKSARSSIESSTSRPTLRFETKRAKGFFRCLLRRSVRSSTRFF